jgi:hypothetical protein
MRMDAIRESGTAYLSEYLVLTIICILIHWAFRLQGNIQRINLI